MDHLRFDALTRLLAGNATRRALLSGVAALFMVRVDTAARKKKKTTLCLNGRTIQSSKKKKKTLLKRGATPGACPPTGCTAACAGKTCGDDGCGGSCGDCGPCGECQGGQCTPKADGISCGGGCRECQAGRCVNKPDGTECPEAVMGRCRAGTCNPMPQCATYGNTCESGRECCYQEPGAICPAPPQCLQKVGAGHRCRFNADCISNVCLGWVCES